MTEQGSRQGLTNCPGCQTWIKSVEGSQALQCPFCGYESAVLGVEGQQKRLFPRRSGLLVASLLGLSALGGLAAPGCGTNTPTEQVSETTPGDGGTVQDAPVLPPYGIPPQDAGPQDTGPQDTGQPDEKAQDVPPAPPYGIPPNP